MLAWVRLALILVHVTVLPTPARHTHTLVPVVLLYTVSMGAGLGGTVVGARVALCTMGTRWAETQEAVQLVHTCPSTQTGVRVTLVYLHVTLLSCISRSAHTRVLVDAVQTLSIRTGVTGAVILVHLTVHS